MIIDIILDRQDAERETPRRDCYGKAEFRDIYDYAMTFEMDYLSRAIDSGTEDDIKSALCRYIDEEEYNPEIKGYICSKNWIPAGIE